MEGFSEFRSKKKKRVVEEDLEAALQILEEDRKKNGVLWGMFERIIVEAVKVALRRQYW